eukprot:scaffold1.g5857.t1
MAELSVAPGSEHYYARVAKLEALPPSDHPPDVVAFLAAHNLLEEAAAALPLPAEGPPCSISQPDVMLRIMTARLASMSGLQPGIAVSAAQAMLEQATTVLPPAAEGAFPSQPTEAAGAAPPSDEQLIGMLKYLTASFARVPGQPGTINHPALAVTWRLLAPLAPLRTPMELPGERLLYGNTPALQALLVPGAPPLRDARTLIQLLMLASIDIRCRDVRSARELLDAAGASLRNAGACRAVDAQLLQLRSADRPSWWSGWAVRSAQELYQLGLVMKLETHKVCSPADRNDMFDWSEHAARELAEVEPRNPHAWAWRGARASDMPTPPRASPREAHRQQQAAARHWRQGVALARESGSAFWTAYFGYHMAAEAVVGRLASIPPRDAAALLDEADAAFERGKPLEPSEFLQVMRDERARARAVQPLIAAHMEHSPSAWEAAVSRAALTGPRALERMGRGLARGRSDVGHSRCDGCGQESVALKSCAYKTAQYCSRECQKEHRPQHKAKCKDAMRKLEQRGQGAGAAAGRPHGGGGVGAGAN